MLSAAVVIGDLRCDLRHFGQIQQMIDLSQFFSSFFLENRFDISCNFRISGRVMLVKLSTFRYATNKLIIAKSKMGSNSVTRAGVCKTLCPQLPDSNTA